MTSFILLFYLLSSCAPGPNSSNPPIEKDILPPILMSAEVLDERRIQFHFDEMAHIVDDVIIEPKISIESTQPGHQSVMIQFGEDQAIGELYQVRVNVTDDSENVLSFLYEFSGWNPRIPEILINELNPQGSTSTPDCVELYVLSDGNLGGITLRIGTYSKYSDELLFPAIDVNAGDFIVVHTKPQGLQEEIDEMGPLDESGGKLALDTARDFWMREAPGLPGSNGALTLYIGEQREILDAVLWSDRADDPTDEQLGWTSTGFLHSQDLGSIGEWLGDFGDIPYPSDAIDASSTTATRSLSRGSTPVDTNSADDWHTTPNRGHTIGEPNTDEAYVPK